MRLDRSLIGVIVLLAAGLLGGVLAVAEPVLGLPNSVSALGAPWLVCAFAVGILARGRLAAAASGALLLSGATGVYYAAQVYGYGPSSTEYATTMAAAWGTAGAAAGGVMATVGALWRRASGTRAALLAAVPAAALAGEAALLSLDWRGAGGTAALATELLAAVALVAVLSWRRAPLSRAAVGAVVLAVAFAVVEAELRGVMRAAGWHGA